MTDYSCNLIRDCSEVTYFLRLCYNLFKLDNENVLKVIMIDISWKHNENVMYNVIFNMILKRWSENNMTEKTKSKSYISVIMLNSLLFYKLWRNISIKNLISKLNILIKLCVELIVYLNKIYQIFLFNKYLIDYI